MLEGYYDTSLVLLSVLVAVLASYTALTLAGRVANAPRRSAPWWIAGGAFAMGTGIWSMHFIGMLAFRLPIPMGYDLGITLLSWGLPIVVSALALWQVSRMHISRWRLLVSGTLLGIGINAMHYLGMAAMRMQPGIDYDYGTVALSMLIAIGAAIISLWIAFRLRHNGPGVWLRRGAAATVMGGAIAGMHYTGMAAASFPLGSVCFAANDGFGPDVLAILVILATFAVLTVAMIISVYDTRLEARSQILALSQATSEERRRLLDRERIARAEVERMSAMKDQFLATLSHELRTPLNAILGWTQLLQVKPHDESALKQALQTIERNAWMQARLIDDLLDMSRIIAGNIRLDGLPVDLATIAEAAMDTAKPAAVAKRIDLIAELDRNVDRVWGDPSRLQQIMWNLISNAVKFTPQGGQVRISLAASDGHAEFSVSDNGIGISEDFLPHVFDRFRQAEDGTTRRYGGLGLGLSIAKQLAELHGGAIAVHSEGAGKGSTFVVRLPLLSVGTAERGALSDSIHVLPAATEFVGADLSGVTVLVVEDEADTRMLVERVLQNCAAQVMTAEGAKQALELLQTEQVDLIISDIGMPGTDGFELMRRVRAHHDRKVAGLPAIALTAFTHAQDANEAMQAGFNTHMPKPVSASELVAEVAVRTLKTGASTAGVIT
jgi:signal transduction histidine kinase/ActR/RegA family two-component response regulator